MWHYCEKCKEIVIHCEHDTVDNVYLSSNTQPLKDNYLDKESNDHTT